MEGLGGGKEWAGEIQREFNQENSEIAANCCFRGSVLHTDLFPLRTGHVGGWAALEWERH